MTILIPAYEPKESFLQLINSFIELKIHDIVVVDDGSGDNYQYIFRQIADLGCIVLHHPKNLGKGAALKTGFSYINEKHESTGVVTADCDGQHTVPDILRVFKAIKKDTIVLGSRKFSGTVPLKSSFGNLLTRKIFALCTGYEIFDTQTGLRGFSTEMLPWLCKIKGDRFEYELNMLLQTKDKGYAIEEVPIATIYEDDNKGTHFKPIRDSIRVYMPFIKFSSSSITSGILDFILLFIIKFFTNDLLVSVIFARVCSSIFNYTANNFLVFKGKRENIKSSAIKYFLLVIVIMTLNYTLLYLLTEVSNIPLFISKLLVEAVLFIFSYFMQKKFVFLNR